MRWLLNAGFLCLIALTAGESSLAHEADDAAHSHDNAATDDDGAHEDHDAAANGDIDEHHGDAHAATVYDGDHDGVEEDYDRPPLTELTAVRFLFALGMFVLFVFIMRAVAWKPLIAALDTREARVNEAHAFVKDAGEQVKILIAQHEERIAETQEQVKSIVAAARKEAEQAKSEIIAQAAEEAQSLQDRSIAEIEQAKQQALGQIEGQVDRYADLATQQVVGHRLGG